MLRIFSRMMAKASRRRAFRHWTVFLVGLLCAVLIFTNDLSAVSYYHDQWEASTPKRTNISSLELHEGILGNEKLLSKLFLCRSVLNVSKPEYSLLNWTSEHCLEEDSAHVHSVSSLEANEPLWASCARQVDPTDLRMDTGVFPLFFSCPSYPKPPRQTRETNSTVVLLENSLRDFDTNIFHVFVLYDSKLGPETGSGRKIWCILDASARFAEQCAKHNCNTHWRLEYKPDKRKPEYVRQLFQLLGNDYKDDDQERAVIPYKLGWNPLPRNGVRKNGAISAFEFFRPKTLPKPFLINIARRVRHIALAEKKRSCCFVLLVLRSDSRRLAGARTGTATEIVLALLKRYLPVRIIDLLHATVAEQMQWFSEASVVVGMHGAGLTNLVWMQSGASTVIEVAASYGWARYVNASDGSCRRVTGEPQQYKKADYYNLARRFRIRHRLIHPVYATSPEPGIWVNPIHKKVFYVDAEMIASEAQAAYNHYDM